MKTQHFNIIRKALDNKENEKKHLRALKAMVKNYEKNFGSTNLSNVLWLRYFKTFIELHNAR
jgi:hypothetical protein